jgi:hypothetical protein
MDLSMFEREIKNTLHVKVIDIEEGEEIGVKDVKQ